MAAGYEKAASHMRRLQRGGERFVMKPFTEEQIAQYWKDRDAKDALKISQAKLRAEARRARNKARCESWRIKQADIKIAARAKFIEHLTQSAFQRAILKARKISSPRSS
jgi:hypothetical protein